jgi:hypothetical protein
MKSEQLEQKLEGLRAAAERISANLVELEVDSSRQLLDATPLEGKSAARWVDASVSLTELWRRQGLLERLVERADKLRRSRKPDELAALLNGRSIELGSSEVPVAERTLLGSSQVAERCSTDELLASMSTLFEEVKGALSAITGAWERLTPKLGEARRLLQAIRQGAEALGEPRASDTATAGKQLDGFSASVTRDPLAIDEHALDDLVRRLRTLRDDVEADVGVKQRFESMIVEARTRLEELREVVREATAAQEELLVKIASPAAVSPLPTHDELEEELDEIVEHAQHGDWRGARRSLEAWNSRIEAEIDGWRRARDANRAPVAARNQFRALLEAYQVKAKRLGVLEDPALEDIFTRAREVLYTAPTDLAVAAQLVRSYQQALSASHPTSEVMR